MQIAAMCPSRRQQSEDVMRARRAIHLRALEGSCLRKSPVSPAKDAGFDANWRYVRRWYFEEIRVFESSCILRARHCASMLS